MEWKTIEPKSKRKHLRISQTFDGEWSLYVFTDQDKPWANLFRNKSSYYVSMTGFRYHEWAAEKIKEYEQMKYGFLS